jgi:uncharacterized membrane protein YheB (UPF0754 family)
MEFLEDIFRNLYFQIALLIIFATAHGYAGAWLAVRMLFRPRMPVKLLGVTVFPQGMIPRHRERLANTIGRAVGEELMSHDTIIKQLTGDNFLDSRIERLVDSYTAELAATNYPSLIDALPERVRPAAMEVIAGLQLKLAEHVRETLQSEESTALVRRFIIERIDEAVSKRVSDVVDDDLFEKIIGFLEQRIASAVRSKVFEENVRDFISRRLETLIAGDVPLGQMFTEDTVALLKEKANDQIGPLIHQLSELAAADKTKNQISALIKREVHDYYQELSFFKKIFVSREALMGEVDELVNETLPKRIEETLQGTFFADEARAFISGNIDAALAKPLGEVIGRVAPDQLDRLKVQVASTVLAMVQSEHTINGISSYLRTTLATLRPHSIDAILQLAYPQSEEKLKAMLADKLVEIIKRAETADAINEMLSAQIDRLLTRPLGRLGDRLPEEKMREFSKGLSAAISSAAAAKLPDAIAGFDVQGMVRQKVSEYPPEKLEKLVLSVAGEHLRTIEVFGAIFGFAIGVLQAVQFYIYAR